MAVGVRSFLWFESGAEEAARFYVSLFADGEVYSVQQFPAGDFTTEIVEFGLGGVRFVAMGSPGAPKPTDAFSNSVICEGQEEVDRLWDALVDGGEPLACGWLRDRFGLSWQITPRQMDELMQRGTEAQRAAVMQTMMGMVKFDVAALERAFEDTGLHM